MRQLPPQRNVGPDDVQVLFKGREPFAFTAAFHGWSKHLEGSKELSRPLDFLGHVTDDNYQRQFYCDNQETMQVLMVEDEDDRAN